MNKRYKLLLLLLCAGIVASAFPSSGAGATSDSIAFYNSKKSILEMKSYDEAYDTNHDGVVNVFDVIRENKEVFQEESYTDLKSKIYSLETQLELLTQKLAEKEDKSRVESDLCAIKSELSGKVDVQGEKQLSSNDYTNEEKQKLENLNNYDDTSIKSYISEISSTLSEKVDSQEGKQLSSNDYTDADKEKLNNLNNYDDTLLRLEISESLSGKVDNQDGKQLSSNDFTDADKSKLEGLNNYDDAEIKSEIADINSNVSQINETVSGKVDQQEGKQLSSNDFTDKYKEKLESLENYDDTKVSDEIKELNDGLSELNKFISSQSDVDVIYINPSDDIVDIFVNNQGKTLILNSGVYDIIEIYKNKFGNDYFDNYIDYSSGGGMIGSGLPLTNGTKLICSPNSKIICKYTGNNPNVTTYFSVFSCGDGYELEGAWMECENIRYAIHDDFNTRNTQFTVKISNCHIVNDRQAIGGGMGVCGTYEIKDNYIYSIKNWYDMRYHNNGLLSKNRLTFTGNIFPHALCLAYYGESDENTTEAFVSNNISSSPLVYKSEDGVAKIQNIKIFQWNNTIESIDVLIY